MTEQNAKLGEGQNFQDIIALADLKEGKIFPITVKGQSVILLRNGDNVRALGGKCPHKGAPMELGAACHHKDYGDVVICPWHKAVFSQETGAVLEPVSFSSLPSYPVAVVEGRVLVGTRALVVPKVKKQKENEHVCIVGAGAAGLSAAYRLREGGFAGRISLIGDEGGHVYDRTSLSKTVIVSESSRAVAPLLMEENAYIIHNITRLWGRVTHCDPIERSIELEDGHKCQADHIIIATGARARLPDLPGVALRGVLTLNSQADAKYMAEVITPDQAIIIIGDGLISLEVASSLRQKGVGVTIITSDPIPMEKQLGREIGMRLLQLYEENSVAFISDSAVTAIYGKEHVEGVELDDGTRLPCSYVISAVGVRPDSACLGETIARGEDGSLLVNRKMNILSSDGHVLENIYAVGDVSAVERGGEFRHFRHWRYAQMQGCIAADAILGHQEREMSAPWYWTQQFGKKIEYIGWGEAFDHVILTGNLRDFNFLATYTYKGRIVGLSGSGRSAEMARALVDFQDFIEKNTLGKIV